MEINDLRRNYENSVLELSNLESDPFRQFEIWFAAASGERPDWLEPNAMTLATADSQGRVSARIVLLKKFGPSGFSFFTNYQSDKAKQLAANPHAGLVFYWPHVERQVRIEGKVSKTDSQTSDEYFHERPFGSQIGAIASPQSRPIADRSQLEQETEKLTQRYQGQVVPRPDYWGGYILSPDRIEFWQGRPSRLHDRFTYERSSIESPWQISRIAP